MTKRAPHLDLEGLSADKLEEHLYVLRTLISKTLTRETDLFARPGRNPLLASLVHRYCGGLQSGAPADVDDFDDDRPSKSRPRDRIMRACKTALQQVERALRALPEGQPLDTLCESLAKTLRMTPCQVSLFRLALAVERNADLRGLCRQIGGLIPDDAAADALRRLADSFLSIGESGVAGLAGLQRAASDPVTRTALQLTPASRILLFGTEGITDQAAYDRILDSRRS